MPPDYLKELVEMSYNKALSGLSKQRRSLISRRMKPAKDAPDARAGWRSHPPAAGSHGMKSPYQRIFMTAQARVNFWIIAMAPWQEGKG